MCNFYGVTMPNKKTVAIKKKEVDVAKHISLLKPVINGFEYGNAFILLEDDSNDIKAVEAHWEFIPNWMNSLNQLVEARKQGIPWLNATSEKLLESKMFVESALHKRCVVLATHFYEWREAKIPGTNKKIKIPYAIKLVGQDYFFMAGIYNHFKDVYTGSSFLNFAIVTTAANELMQEIHNNKKRMPTILAPTLAEQWLKKDLKENYINSIASYGLPSESMEAFTIANNFKDAINPLLKVDYTNILQPNTLF
jgi:putative SOS response-associated peptidase YedK